MGNREDLLAGAKRCLIERGYARTTARDIAAAAGTSLASIGYHFKSTETLLNVALMQALGDWGETLQRALAVELPADATPLERFERYWRRMIEAFTGNTRLLMGSMEALAQAERVPELRAAVATGLQEGRQAWAATLRDLAPTASGAAQQALGSLHQALLTGVLVQWLVDPDRAPTSQELTEALRLIAEGVAGSSRARPPTRPRPVRKPKRRPRR